MTLSSVRRFAVVSIALGAALLICHSPQPAMAATDPGGPDPFVGSFKGDKLSLDLERSGGSYVGTISLGDRKFPLKARADGAKLRGTFESDGETFDFSAAPAAQDGRGLTFVSGSTTYALTKQAINPLAKPRNAPKPDVAPKPPDAPAAAPQVLRFTRAAITDPLVNNSTAATVLVPAGWKLEANVIWRENAYYPVTMAMQIYDPNGPRGLSTYPQLVFYDGIRESAARTAAIAGPEAVAAAVAHWPEGGNYGGFEVRRRIAEPADFVRQMVVPRFRRDLQNARIVAVEDRPEYAKAQAAKYAGAPGVQIKSQKIRVEYALRGHDVQEDFYCTLGAVPMGDICMSWGAEVESYRAEKGQLDEAMALFRAIDHSAKIDLQWYNAVMQVAEMMKDAAAKSTENAGKLSKYIAARNDEISDIIRGSYQQQQATMDRINENFDRTIRGVEPYKSPFEDRPVEVPSGYNHAYTSAQGEVILTNDPNFKPEQAFRGDWREMEKGK